MKLVIREEAPADVDAIHRVNAAAFDTEAIAFSPVVVTRADGKVQELVPGGLDTVSGVVRYGPEFDAI